MSPTRSTALACLLATVVGCTSTLRPELPAEDDETDRKSVCTAPDHEGELIQEVLDLVNEARAADGLDALVLSETLGSVAEAFACEMVETNFFAHENPHTKVNPGERLTAAGYIYYVMAENLAVGQTSAQQVVDAWMDSPPHRTNILSPDWREVGISVRNGGAFGWYWVQEFADPVEFADR